MKAQENKENHRAGKRPILLGPPPPLMNGEQEAAPGFGPGTSQVGRSPHKNDLPLADEHLLELIEGDPTKSLPIDDIPRTIRFYGETAAIVMEDNKVCELSFKPDPEDRNVIIDDSIVIYTCVNQGYKEFEVDGEKHEIKIGPPTRELWIDGKWYECYFNNRVGVMIGSHMHEVFLDGQPPNVDIGEPRPDLCLGRIYALLDGNMKGRIPIFLDRKPQRIDIAGKPHIIQFVDGFKTLTINGHPFRSDFGGFPMVISVLGKKHYLRLTALPRGINLDHLPPGPSSSTLSPRSPGAQLRGPSPSSSSMPPAPPAPIPPPVGANDTDASKNVDVNAIFASLQKFDWSGFGVNIGGSGGGGIPGLTVTEPEVPAMEVKPPPELVPQPVIKNTPNLKVASAPIKPIVLASHHASLKERQESIIEQLYRAADLQCKSCGVRFSKEEMPQYTSHLDWHFRMKRREKDNAKRAQSRKWYFEKNDWIESDEIEDEASEEKIEEEEKEEEEIVIKTVPVGDGQKNTACPVCREDFDQFYKQSGEGVEEEGWYFHNAMIHDGVIYHPECFKDLEKNGECLETSMDTTADSTADSNMDTSTPAVQEPEDQEQPMEADLEVKPTVADA